MTDFQILSLVFTVIGLITTILVAWIKDYKAKNNRHPEKIAVIL